ncbi:MAG TPA: MFS transporter [Rhizomicrobium sp.]|nr:MFS transporter [Rhizomicrobium sp.]
MADVAVALPHNTFKFRHVFAVSLGNGLEFYDFLSYALFSVYIGHAFFPANDKSVSLLLSLAVFGIGFITRPIGAIVLGSLGDRIGRKPAMLISFLMMGLGMLGLALTPTYASIGVAAPLLVIFFRLIQGFALGGEIGPTTAYMVEAAPPEHRGLYGSMQYTTQDFAQVVAAVIALALTTVLTADQLQAFGWRIVFLIGVLIVPFGLYIRNNLPETLHAADDAALAPDATRGSLSVRARLSGHWGLVIAGLMLLTTGTIGSYVLTYMTTYALDTLHMTADISFGVTVVSSGIAIIFEPVSGILSDRCGRKPVIVAGFVATLLAVLPAFWLINTYPSMTTLYGCIAVVSLLFAIATPPCIIALTEGLPKTVRAGAVSTIYAFAISIFGGTTQFAIKGLIYLTHNPLAPAYYWMGALVVGLIGATLMRETAPVKVRRA